MIVAICVFYGLFLLVALINLVLMHRPRVGPEAGPELLVLIPARNEEENLRELLPQLSGVRTIVFDDESTDGTAVVATEFGARVVRPESPLPNGWTGKNRACDALGQAALEEDAPWWLFLDADVRIKPGGLARLKGLIAEVGDRCPMITGFGEMKPGRGVEPLFLAWVGWILLASNPFGLVGRTRRGHSGFKNGQIHAWRRETYAKLRPHKRVRGRIMEDVMIGRLMARKKLPVEVANLADCFTVRMYDTWRQTLDGMSKNSFEITGSAGGSVALAAFFVLAGWLWLAAWPLWWVGLSILTLSGLTVAFIARSAKWPTLIMPIVLTIAGYTVLRSLWWKRTGQTTWKGRTYV